MLGGKRNPGTLCDVIKGPSELITLAADNISSQFSAPLFMTSMTKRLLTRLNMPFLELWRKTLCLCFQVVIPLYRRGSEHNRIYDIVLCLQCSNIDIECEISVFAVILNVKWTAIV